jgi:hypothetical protein
MPALPSLLNLIRLSSVIQFTSVGKIGLCEIEIKHSFIYTKKSNAANFI